MHNFIICILYVACPMTGERRAEFWRAWGLGLDAREQIGGGGTGRPTQSVLGHYKPLKGKTLTVLEMMHRFIMHILQAVQPVWRGQSVRRGVCLGRG